MFVFAKFYFQGRLVTNSSTSIGDNDPSRFLHVYKRLQTKTHSCSKKCDCFVILLLQLILSYSLHANLKRLCLKLAKIQNGGSQREIHLYATTFVFECHMILLQIVELSITIPLGISCQQIFGLPLFPVQKMAPTAPSTRKFF